MLKTILLFATLLAFSTVHAATIHVPSEQPTIQDGILAARTGDIVLVGPGIYYESINFLGKRIVVRSSDGPLATTITNERTVDLVTFDHGETRSTVLDGFTLRGGWMAVLIVGSAPTISHNICIEQNVWNWSAIGLCGWFVYIDDPTGDPRYSPRIGPAGAAIVNNTIIYSSNGGISSFSTVPPLVENNIIAFNAHYGFHQQSSHEQPQPLLNYNDVYGLSDDPSAYYEWYINIADPGDGSFRANPLIHPDGRLMDGSPCIDAGNPDPAFNDADGSRNDMGAVPYGTEPAGGVIPTNEWVVLYCDHPEDGYSAGKLLQAFDPDGVLCGQCVIRKDGRWGYMPVYRDDPYSDVDEGCEPGDLISFSIDGRETPTEAPIVWSNSGDFIEVCDLESSLCTEIPLHTGWNLISWNVQYSGPIEETLADIMGCVDVVQSYEQGGLTFDPELAAYSTLTEVDYYHGYWIRMNCDAILEVCGKPANPLLPIPLEAGWNLVAFWGWEDLDPYYALYSVLNAGAIAMGFDNGGLVWTAPFSEFNTLTAMRPGFGYWVKVTRDIDLVYLLAIPCLTALPPMSMPPVIAESAVASTTVPTSRVWMSVYGEKLTVDGLPLADGSEISFVTNDLVMCGAGTYADGKLLMTSVYGQDGNEASGAYPSVGESVGVMVNGARVYPDLNWTGEGSRVRLSALSSDANGLPGSYALAQNYPNPFNPATEIAFCLPNAGRVTLEVYNVVGQKVTTLLNGPMAAGRHTVTWHADSFASGVYFYRLTAGSFTETKKMLLLK